MPKLSLSLHPDSRSPVTRIEVDVARLAPDLLNLTYSIFGELGLASFPPAQACDRTDQLWKRTCMEAFVGAGQGYCEFNFSPSTQWAAYRFDAHRMGMRDAEVDAPSITWRMEGKQGQLHATLRLPQDASGPLGLSAIIESKDGTRSYWALAHPPGAPDFHHPACFAAQLPPAG